MSVRETWRNSPSARFIVALGVQAPLIAEVVASFNTPAIIFPIALIALGPLYGASALLVRELWVRQRIGAVGAILLGLAFAALDEGVFTGVWFDAKVRSGGSTSAPKYFSATVLGRAHGVNWSMLALHLLFHSVFGILVPIAIVSAQFPQLRGKPVLKRRGVIVALSLLTLIALLGVQRHRPRPRSTCPRHVPNCGPRYAGQRAAMLGIIVAVVLVALVVSRRRARRTGRSVPTIGALRAVGFGYSCVYLVAFFGITHAGPAVSIPLTAALAAGATALATRWFVSVRWTDRHTVALTFGALLPTMLASIIFIIFLQPVAAGLYWWWLERLDRRLQSATPDVAGAP